MTIAFRACRFAAPLLLALASVGCGSDDDATDDTAQLRQEVVENYAALVSSGYADSLKTAKQLDSAVEAFLSEPSEVGLEAAKAAWLVSRDPYGETEAFRFYQGPIDNDDSNDDIDEGPEGLINSWPLDESYIDYTLEKGKVVATGIINDTETYPKLDAKALADANAAVGEDAISTGYHAIEFLLWGQDWSETGPGERPYTDYVLGADGTAENPGRRGDYLSIVSKLLVEDLSFVNDAWLEGEDNYRKAFLAMPTREAVGKIMLGMGSLAGSELSHERMEVAYENKEQEDEHSCFSDNTLSDLHNNAKSVQNVLLGQYGKVSGTGIADLVAAKDAKLAKDLRDQIQTAIDEIDAIKELGVPFDQAILGDDDSEPRQHIAAAVASLNQFKETLVQAAKAIGVELKFDE